MSSSTQEDATSGDPWYANESVLAQEVARAIAGYKGRFAAGCHVIPQGWVVYDVYEDDIETALDVPHARLRFHVESSCGYFTRPSVKAVRSRIRQLCQVVVDDDNDEGDTGILACLQPSFYYIEVAIEDAVGVRFELDVLLNYCSADGGKEAAGCVWDRHTGKLVGHWPGSYLSVEMTWIDAAMAARFVPHPADVIPTTEDKMYEASDHDTTFASLCPQVPIYCSLADGQNQLELLVVTVINLAFDERWFPQRVPRTLLDNAKAAYFKTVLGGEHEWATQLASEYLYLALYVDQDATKYY
ncbi:Aste57867_1366 [Aphanomyces stellatus]|uniref:Aste57867_1366 protein n=1 Tax=Aphanomyces stellatus TaxID=120398 RepID=A0A485K5G0_9STRA|nr:hypothetical protein As57867_001365 [Aphanomyces stellatus]VFT78584.1 Aste57867_1366 [Aphanomyces stellatus]